MLKPMLRGELQIKDWVQGLAEIPAAEFTQDNIQNYILEIRHTSFHFGTVHFLLFGALYEMSVTFDPNRLLKLAQ